MRFIARPSSRPLSYPTLSPPRRCRRWNRGASGITRGPFRFRAAAKAGPGLAGAFSGDGRYPGRHLPSQSVLGFSGAGPDGHPFASYHRRTLAPRDPFSTARTVDLVQWGKTRVGERKVWRWVYGPKPPTKRLSGPRRRAIAWLLPPGRRGKPSGPTSLLQERHFYLQRALAWIGEPKLSSGQLSES
jgi:hypothetical protein